MKRLWIDIETFSPVDIRNGTDNYSRAAELLLFAYAPDNASARVWDATREPMPADLKAALADQTLPLVAHNARFEASVLDQLGYGIAPSRWRCTMAKALAHGLPGALETLCAIFKIDDDKAKLKDGKALVRLFCCPQKFKNTLRKEQFPDTKAHRAAVAAAREKWAGRATRESHPEEWARFVDYCRLDVEAMREVAALIPNWNYKGTELELWHLDQAINQRGVPIDMALVQAALETADRVKADLADEAHELTDGAIAATTQRDALLSILNGVYDLGLEDLRASTVEGLLKSDLPLPGEVIALLNNRLAASSTSVAKYRAFAKLTGPDGRLRNTLQFCGASRTGRWAGRGVQLQNLPRPSLKQQAIDRGIEDVKAGVADLVLARPMELLQSAVRGCIVAPAGKKLVVADLSNIEGRTLAWLAGEEWKLQAFRDFDTCLGADGNWYTGDQLRDAALARRPIVLELDRKGEPKRKGFDLYALAYAKAFRITPEAVLENKATGDGSMRQIGKVMELALGYEGGVGAFVTFALAYGIDLDDMAAKALSSIPQRVREEAERAYEWAVKQKRTFGMAKDTYVVCDSFKRLWREAHPKTAVFWKALQTAFVNAISAPGSVHYARDIRVTMAGKWVRMTLPSGRSLCYPSPKLDDNNRISYMGVNQYSRQWSRLHTYSGKLAENATQAAARDIIAAAIPAVERAGYEIVSLVHDEDITVTPDTPEFNEDHLAAIMAQNPAWAAGLPLAAAGFSAYRYRKD